MRASFTQENIEGMKAFDPELARKAQIAYDHKLPINFQQLELIEESLPRLLEEKKQLENLRDDVAQIPAGGPYELPPNADTSAVRPAPGQTDLEGTMYHLAEVKYPGKLEAVINDLKMLDQNNNLYNKDKK